MPAEIVYEPTANALRLVLAEGTDGSSTRGVPAQVDVGEGGRLLGVEVALAIEDSAQSVYVPIEEATGANVRTAPALVRVRTAPDGRLLEVELPRRGAGYEITYPSGNR